MSDARDSFPPCPEMRAGEVWLAGAGPGDPTLLTVLALHALRSADVVIHDALVDPRILSLARAHAVLAPAGKRGGKPSTQQSDINERIVAEARAGRRVLRLKGGDPFVFGRGAEEAAALVAAGIPFRIVPGLTAGLAGLATVAIPTTSRETNHAIVLAAGHRRPDAATLADWEALGRLGQPIVFYMGLPNLAEIAAALMRGGLAADTPVALLASATQAAERIVETRLDAAAATATSAALEPPALVVIGRIVELRHALLPALLRRS